MLPQMLGVEKREETAIPVQNQVTTIDLRNALSGFVSLIPFQVHVRWALHALQSNTARVVSPSFSSVSGTEVISSQRVASRYMWL